MLKRLFDCKFAAPEVIRARLFALPKKVIGLVSRIFSLEALKDFLLWIICMVVSVIILLSLIFGNITFFYPPTNPGAEVLMVMLQFGAVICDGLIGWLILKWMTCEKVF